MRNSAAKWERPPPDRAGCQLHFYVVPLTPAHATDRPGGFVTKRRYPTPRSWSRVGSWKVAFLRSSPAMLVLETACKWGSESPCDMQAVNGSCRMPLSWVPEDRQERSKWSWEGTPERNEAKMNNLGLFGKLNWMLLQDGTPLGYRRPTEPVRER